MPFFTLTAAYLLLQTLHSEQALSTTTHFKEHLGGSFCTDLRATCQHLLHLLLWTGRSMTMSRDPTKESGQWTLVSAETGPFTSHSSLGCHNPHLNSPLVQFHLTSQLYLHDLAVWPGGAYKSVGVKHWHFGSSRQTVLGQMHDLHPYFGLSPTRTRFFSTSAALVLCILFALLTLLLLFQSKRCPRWMSQKTTFQLPNS